MAYPIPVGKDIASQVFRMAARLRADRGHRTHTRPVPLSVGYESADGALPGWPDVSCDAWSMRRPVGLMARFWATTRHHADMGSRGCVLSMPSANPPDLWSLPELRG